MEMLAAYDVLDQHALKATPSDETSIESLAKYLVAPAKTAIRGARFFFLGLGQITVLLPEPAETSPRPGASPGVAGSFRTHLFACWRIARLRQPRQNSADDEHDNELTQECLRAQLLAAHDEGANNCKNHDVKDVEAQGH